MTGRSHRTTVLLFTLVLLAACASEDPDLVNPPPFSNSVGIRFWNAIPDGKVRALQLEGSITSAYVASGQYAGAIRPQSDSSLLRVLKEGAEEFVTQKRASFTRNSILSVFAVVDPTDPTRADTVAVHTAFATLLTTPNATIRLVNMDHDTTASYSLRSGCQNGPVVCPTTGFTRATLFAEVPAGVNVFSLVRHRQQGEELIGLFDCTLQEYRPYSLVITRSQGRSEPDLTLIFEADTTSNGSRPFMPIQAGTAAVRVVNVSSTNVSVIHENSAITLANGLSATAIGSYVDVPACTSVVADRFAITYDDGRTTLDSASLTVRGRYTVIVTDSGTQGASITVGPARPPTNAASSAVLRVVHAAPTQGSIVMNVGARTDATTVNGFSSGKILANNLSFRSVSEPVAVPPGVLPITVTSVTTPTNLLYATTVRAEAGKSYIVVLDSDQGRLRVSLLEQDDAAQPLPVSPDAALVQVLNGSVRSDAQLFTVGNIVENGRLYYRNSLATCLESGAQQVSADQTQHTLQADPAQRSLVIATSQGDVPVMFDITTPPMNPEYGITKRRVINATADVAFVSIAYDSIPQQGGSEMLVDRVPFGVATAPVSTNRERRGTFFVYDSDTLTELFRLPINYAPLSSSTSLVVVGRKEKGYEVLIVQEY